MLALGSDCTLVFGAHTTYACFDTCAQFFCFLHASLSHLSNENADHASDYHR